MTIQNKRFEQLREAALNLGMSNSDAQHYATEALNKELRERSEHEADRDRAYSLDHGNRS